MEKNNKKTDGEEKTNNPEKKIECPFCAIVQGQSDSIKIIYQDKDVVAFLYPYGAAGHFAVIPVKHVPVVVKLDEKITQKMFAVAKKLLPLVCNATMTKSANIIMHTGTDQKISHVSLHVLPRKTGDGISIRWEPSPMDETKLKELEEKLKGSVSKEEEKNIKEKTSDIKEDSYLIKHLNRLP
ncbi:HIT family protein [Candidatus Woesearchaeota archaeon]|nr:HIT family protein [Candidatus Woesearchaeota archaeon]